MEIKITDGKVSRVAGRLDTERTPLAHRARVIANYLPLEAQRLGADIVHNEDAHYTGIRFNTKAGAVVLEIPPAGGSYRLVLEFDEPDEKTGKTGKVLQQIPQLYSPNGIALQTYEFLRSRGFLK
ncbi:hypothetical protein ACIP5U_37425 [Streptomyces sp. NPDC088788]|uniref:hypothetical protein n=1 Tax=Streptomyces sp. NPDC088788 TaxID=3365898 RepID=UPI0038220008